MSPAYNVAAALILRGAEIDVQSLKQAVVWVVQRHPALRTFLRDNEQAIAVVQEHDQVVIPVSELVCVDETTATRKLTELQASVSSRAFDLNSPPLWRCHIVRISDTTARIIFAAHHFVADGWSLARTLRELAFAYGEFLDGRTPMLPMPPTDYTTYAAWQRRELNSASGCASLKWWRESLRGFESPIEFPTDFRRPKVLSDRGERIAFALDPETATALREFAASHRASITSVVSAVHAVLLHRYSRTERFSVGMAVSIRPSAAFHDVFGFFVNWIPLKADFSDEPTFEEFFKGWEEGRLAALRHRNTPTDAIVREVGPQSELARHPLFQHMMVSHVPARGVQFRGLRVCIEPLSTGTSKLDMTLFLTDTRRAVEIEAQGDIFLEIEYSSDLFMRRTVEVLADSLTSLIRSATARPNCRVNLLPLVSADSATPLVSSVKSVDHATASCLSGLRAIIERYPFAPAVVCDQTILTYLELGDRAASVAEALRAAGVEKGDRVGMFLPRTPDLIASLIGIMLSGGCFVPLERTLPQARLRCIVDDASPACVITTSTLENDAKMFCGETRLLCADTLNERANNAWGRATEFTGCDIAYLLYTSGSTGRPKGVLGSHGPLANFVAWLNSYLTTGPSDRVLCKTPLSFDASIREVVAPLCSGATLILAGDDYHLNPASLTFLVATQGVTILHATPTVYREILVENQSRRQLISLRHVMCGGEPLNASLSAAHFHGAPQARLHNVYGPTECTVDVTFHEILRGHEDVLLGQPIPGAAVYVADSNLGALPAGAVGEIVIGGLPVGPGYWRGEDEQRARFVIPADGPLRGKRVFRTGDLGRVTGSGDLSFFGRSDRQIKVRGARVELGEIEHVILAHRDVVAATVIVSHAEREECLVAFVRFVDGVDSAATIDLLQRHLITLLPKYMQPTDIVPIDHFPKLISGKVDYSALFEMWTPRTLSRRKRELTVDEVIVCKAMSELLERDIESADADFFRSGGHSLSAARLIAKVAKDTGVMITLRELFENPTVAELAVILTSKRIRGECRRIESISQALRPRGFHG
jgi:amino acid adenylation domain-containing protein